MADDIPCRLGTAPGAEALQAGDRVPDATFRLREGAQWIERSTGEIFGGRTVVVHGRADDAPGVRQRPVIGDSEATLKWLATRSVA